MVFYMGVIPSVAITCVVYGSIWCVFVYYIFVFY